MIPQHVIEINSESDEAAACTNAFCNMLPNVLIAFFLVLLILLTIFGNILVVLSVVVYKRMRTFTNILLTSLATSDLLVGLMVMPLSLVDLLHQHKWPFNPLLCNIWATTDVLLCTASILNLCIISIDRYLAINYPLKYSRTRSKSMAFGLLSAVWGVSIVVCIPPWIINAWKMNSSANNNKSCSYPPSIGYRIYSALGSFYIPLLVMLSVYFKIFRVASAREAMMHEGLGTCRLSKRVVDENIRKRKLSKNSRLLADKANRQKVSAHRRNDTRFNMGQLVNKEGIGRNDVIVEVYHYHKNLSTTSLQSARSHNQQAQKKFLSTNETPSNYMYRQRRVMREYASLIDLSGPITTPKEEKSQDNIVESEEKTIVTPSSSNDDDISNKEVPTLVKKAQMSYTKLQPSNLMAKAQSHYNTYGPGRIVRGSKEKMVYLRERKALKTIGIVVMGFIICWMPFFVLYLIEVLIDDLHESAAFGLLNEFFLWLGYSNSVLNPIIYTMYNGDFRRCFRDLLTFGCLHSHRRTMSVRKLHQQSTTF
uniref:G_PROTEIN_RECEP_F1_2 domain-containing protein n=1 Tax=Rhabditophanes sp. KR3021 TaxID=114890 RepID=A0AC35TLK8_9BILA